MDSRRQMILNLCHFDLCHANDTPLTQSAQTMKLRTLRLSMPIDSQRLIERIQLVTASTLTFTRVNNAALNPLGFVQLERNYCWRYLLNLADVARLA